MAKPKGLGRGLDALLAVNHSDDQLQTLPIHAIEPGKYQPRTHMDAAALEALAESIRAQGVIQPLVVRPVGYERYELIAGERRWRASQLAGLAEVPAVVRTVPDEAALAMALIENIQREDLNPLEEALGLKRLADEFGMTHEAVAAAVGRSRSAASNLLFAWLAGRGHDVQALIFVISADNLASGIASAAFIAYLSSLTNVNYSATQYAMFSSMMLLLPKFVAGYSGAFVDHFGYASFFTATSLLGLPVLVLVWMASNAKSASSPRDAKT